jgi:hypothetical protein
MASDIDFLDETLEGEPTFQFQRPCNLGRTVQSFNLALEKDQSKTKSRGQYLVFTDIPYDVVDRLYDKKGSQIFHCRLLYLHEKQTLRIRVPCLATEILSCWFVSYLGLKLRHMGIFRDFSMTGASCWHMGGVSKSTDQGWASKYKR